MGCAITALALERESALLFGAHYTNLKLLLWIHYLARRFLYADLIAALSTSGTRESGSIAKP